MNRKITTLALAVLTAATANAQAVLGYNLSETQGSYTPLTNANVIYDAAGSTDADFGKKVITDRYVTSESGSAPGIDIGFDMNFAGTVCNSFLVSGAGYLYLGSGDIEFDCYMQANFQTWSGDYACFGLGVNRGVTALTDTRISYATSGSGDDARLIVQYENLGICYNYFDPGSPVDFQLILDAKGNFEIVFSGMSRLTVEDSGYQLFLGVRQGEEFVCAFGDSGSLGEKRNSREFANFTPATPDGTTIRFSAPVACVKPQTQPTALELGSTSDEITGSFTAAADADNYLVLYTEGDAVAGTPVDGTGYAEGDKLGDATVAYSGPDTEFILYQMPGGVDYTFTVYAANAYGLDGPAYNTVSPLTAEVATRPAPVQGVEILSASITEVSLNVTGNEAGDEIVVLYTDYCDRSMYGDHGLIGELGADLKVDDVLPVPADFTPYFDFEGAPMPANGGTVAYIGNAGETFSIANLTPGTGYFLAVYTRNAEGVYTSRPFYTQVSTDLENPYSGDSYNFPRFELPAGWTTSENDGNTYGFRDEAFQNYTTNGPSQGTQIMQQRVNMTRGDAVNGKEAWLTVAPVVVNDRHVMARFDYSIIANENRFQSAPYNNWAEGDVLEIRLSEDNGENWTVLTQYTPEEHPEMVATDEVKVPYVSISADLNEYRGRKVLVQLYWKTFAIPGFGANMYVDRFSLQQGEFPAVPEVSVNKITHNSAVVSWISQQTDYELAYSETGGNVTHTVKVDGATTYTLEGLVPETEYTVKVRGLLSGEGEEYSEWSDPVVFITAGYPAVDAPENLQSDTETFGALGYVQLSWGKAVDALSYEVAYRLASSTEWIYKECEETSLLLTELEAGEAYVWKVRAFCTHDRETVFSAQARFTAPEKSGVEDVVAANANVSAGRGYVAVEGAEGASVAVYNASGVQVAATADASPAERYPLAAGLYIVVVDNLSYKVVVK